VQSPWLTWAYQAIGFVALGFMAAWRGARIYFTGNPEMLHLLGDSLSHVSDEVHYLWLSFVFLATMTVLCVFTANVWVGEQRRHYFTLFRFLFTRDARILVSEPDPQAQVKLWRRAYRMFTLGQLLTILNSLILFASYLYVFPLFSLVHCYVKWI
jgi:hypothetical protein